MSLNDLIIAAAEGSESAVNPYVVGGGVLAFLMALLLALLAFAGGREHS